MQITVCSFIVAAGWSSLLMIVIYLLRKMHFFRNRFPVVTVVLLYLLCVIRACFPLDFPQAVVLSDRTIYPLIYRALMAPMIQDSCMSVWSLCMILWATVAGVLLIRYAAGYCNTIRKIHRYAVLCDGKESVLLNKIIKQSHQKIPVTLYRASGINTAFGLGIWRKKILIPDTGYSLEELRYILLHEYTHFCNKDIPVKLAVSIFCMIFWWNPFVYLLQKDLEQTLELKCDAAATGNMPAEEKAGYLRTMIHVLESAPDGKESPYVSVTFIKYNAAAEIKERFSAVIHAERGNVHKTENICCIGCFLMLLFFSYAVIPQPVFEAPTSNEPGITDYSPCNSYILQTKSGRYWLCIRNRIFKAISYDEAQFHLAIGFSLKKGELYDISSK